MEGTSISFGFGLEEGLLQQLLVLNGTEAPAAQPGSSNFGHQPLSPPTQDEPQLSPRSGASQLEVPSPSTDMLYRPFLAHLLQAHGGPRQTVPSQYFDSSIADFCSAHVESIKDVPEDSRDAEAEDEAEEGELVNTDQQRARYLGGVSKHMLKGCLEG